MHAWSWNTCRAACSLRRRRPALLQAQMHKEVPPPRTWRSLILRHEHLVQRLYYLPGAGTSPAKPAGMPLLNSMGGNAGGAVRKPSKQPSKKRKR